SLIAAGEVEIDGIASTDPFAPIDADALAALSLRGHPLALADPDHRIYRYHKPRGMLCSHDDPFSGNTLGRVLRAEGFLGYTWAGRLDEDAEGLLLVTNCGDVIQALTHPRYGVRKEYVAALDGRPSAALLRRALATMREGVIDDGETLRILDGEATERPPSLRLVLAEGRKHEVKRLISGCGLRLSRLQRVSVGPIGLGDLGRGAFARLALDEEREVLQLARDLRRAHGEGIERDL
ncbi:MAG: pseudouridine synthase, partial [Candidatus Bipolaricaulota bacterium]